MNLQARSGDRNLLDAISTQYKWKAKASFEIAFTIHPKRFTQTCDNDDRIESIRVNFDFNLPQFNATDNQGSLCFVNHAGNIAAFTMAWNRLRIIMQIMCICNVMSVGMLDAAAERANVLATLLVKMTLPWMCAALAFHGCRTYSSTFSTAHKPLSNLTSNTRE